MTRLFQAPFNDAHKFPWAILNVMLCNSAYALEKHSICVMCVTYPPALFGINSN